MYVVTKQNLSWTLPKHFGTDQKLLFTTVYTMPKTFVLSETNWTSQKQFGRVQNSFGPIEGESVNETSKRL